MDFRMHTFYEDVKATCYMRVYSEGKRGMRICSENCGVIPDILIQTSLVRFFKTYFSPSSNQDEPVGAMPRIFYFQEKGKKQNQRTKGYTYYIHAYNKYMLCISISIILCKVG